MKNFPKFQLSKWLRKYYDNNQIKKSPKQKDIATGTLTVRENLMFCANLRLPNTVPPSEKRELVDRVLNDLNISHCADTKVCLVFIMLH